MKHTINITNTQISSGCPKGFGRELSHHRKLGMRSPLVSERELSTLLELDRTHPYRKYQSCIVYTTYSPVCLVRKAADSSILSLAKCRMRSFTSGRRNSPLYKYPDQIMRVGRMGVTQLQLLLGGREGGNFAPLASARFNCYQSELFQRSGPHFSFRLDASFGAYVCVCVVCLPIHDTDQGEPGLPSKSPNRHHSTCPFWHQRRHCQSVF